MVVLRLTEKWQFDKNFLHVPSARLSLYQAESLHLCYNEIVYMLPIMIDLDTAIVHSLREAATCQGGF